MHERRQGTHPRGVHLGLNSRSSTSSAHPYGMPTLEAEQAESPPAKAMLAECQTWADLAIEMRMSPRCVSHLPVAAHL